MDDFRLALGYIFFLSILLLVLVYYVGLTQDLPTVKDFIVSLIYSATGRNSQGAFAQYPTTPAKAA